MNIPALVVPTIILGVATYTDLKVRKIFNKWVVIAIVLALINSYVFYDWEGLKQGAMASGISLLMTLPLVLLGALGAGDMKLLFAFSLTSTYQDTFSIIILSFLWAAVVGIGIAIATGRGKTLAKNTFFLLSRVPTDKDTYQKIPYTVAISLAWLTYVILGIQQGGL